jgi:hypothetical protein
LDSLEDRGDVADRFGLAEMDGFWLHTFDHTPSLFRTQHPKWKFRLESR